MADRLQMIQFISLIIGNEIIDTITINSTGCIIHIPYTPHRKERIIEITGSDNVTSRAHHWYLRRHYIVAGPVSFILDEKSTPPEPAQSLD